MDLFDAIASRRSYKLLVEPAPSAEQLERILMAAVSAPDHQTLQPWRFVVITGEAKEELSLRSVAALQTRAPETPPGKLEKEASKLRRAPMVIAVATTHIDTKLPFSELVAATNAAVQNLLLAATALGFGTIWRTGAAVEDQWLKGELGLSGGDQLAGFIYIGTVSAETPPPAPRTLDLRAAVSTYSPGL